MIQNFLTGCSLNIERLAEQKKGKCAEANFSQAAVRNR